MATNLAIDDNLLEEARIVGKHATKRAVVNEALAEYIQRRKQADIIDLFHKIDYDTDYDYKVQRKKK
jgi:putative antitoxin of VapBC-like toxin-antitoxin system